MLMYCVEHIKTEKTGSPECFSVFLVTNNERRMKAETAINHKTLAMRRRIAGVWRDFASDTLLACLRQHLGVDPVSMNQLIMMLSDAYNYECVRTVQGLIQYLPVTKQDAIAAIAARRELEVQGLIDDEDK
jgi:hypothetical protein